MHRKAQRSRNSSSSASSRDSLNAGWIFSIVITF